ncbi:ferritin-like domain-containing protein [Mucilaginibacter sp. PAMB04274]|uniref:ferritin-like domain-containing protein n=1 Tax=Mucilaginibacter sp. PAMB04274 TaxID=3138568 RepID=UPI0031F65D8A
MDFLNLFNEIQAADPEFADRISPRRAAIRNITSFGSKVAVAALPFAFSTLFKKAYGQTAIPSVTDVLNFALTAELTEACFYNTAIARNIVPAGTARDAITLIRNDENNHVRFLKDQLKTAISPENAARVTDPILVGNTNAFFDYSGGKSTAGTGPFSSVFTDYDVFLAVAQAFEDTGVRAYKGQAGFLKGNAVVLTAALDIHSVEARHASYLRRLRMLRPSGVPTTFRPWVTQDGTTASGISVAPSVVNLIYQNEANVSQGGKDLTTISGVTVKAATESFDEPLTKEQTLAILSNFVIK